ncbi:MAG: exodeoxyribonuclease V subunit gamma [Bacteroidales bacterium]|nr:exodeoxyribonuclease V subunit gamma [Bacteroidales bacterium]
MAEMFPIQKAEIIESPNIKSVGETMLAKLQQSILANHNVTFDTTDDSLQVNSCFTPAREVECLYNYLLNSFELDRSLKPSDVLVITPDIDTYAPFIRAVFQDAPAKIPFRVSGEKRKMKIRWHRLWNSSWIFMRMTLQPKKW